MTGQLLSTRCASVHGLARLSDLQQAGKGPRRERRGRCLPDVYLRSARSWYISAAGMPQVKAILAVEMTTLTTDSLPCPCHSWGCDLALIVPGLATQERHARSMIKMMINRLMPPSFLRPS